MTRRFFHLCGGGGILNCLLRQWQETEHGFEFTRLLLHTLFSTSHTNTMNFGGGGGIGNGDAAPDIMSW